MSVYRIQSGISKKKHNNIQMTYILGEKRRHVNIVGNILASHCLCLWFESWPLPEVLK